MAEWVDSEISGLTLHSPHSNAFVDVNEDLIADLCLTMKKDVRLLNELIQNLQYCIRGKSRS